jgi:GDP-L-fucose synthase
MITGTNGFIGRNLKEAFQDKFELDCPKRQQLDLLDSEAVYAHLGKSRPDAVVHCAVNITSVEQNLKMHFALERCSGFFGKMICVGSAAEYDMRHYVPRMTEDYFGKHVPADVYGFSKYVAALDIESRPRNIYNLRVFGIYGKYEDTKRRFITNNICRALCDMPISMNKNMYFDYLYVDDFARIVETFVRKSASKRSYNICTGTRVDLLTLAELIRTVDGRDRPIVVKEEGLKPEYSGDNGLFLREFGNFAFTPPAKAIEELYRWHQNPINFVLDPKNYA